MSIDPASTVTAQPMPWLDSFDVGDMRIDGEHRALIQMANELCALVQQPASLAMIRAAARDLIAVVEAHFESEEALFPTIFYPDQRAHVREHNSILTEMRTLLLDGGPPQPVGAATARLLMIEHILRHDLGFKTWVGVAHGQ